MARASAPALLVIAVALLLPATAFGQVSGWVLEQGTLSPLAGARVSMQASNVETTTAADGAFDLAAPPGPLVVVAAHKGYFHSWASVQAPQAAVVLSLEPVPDDDAPDYVFPPPLDTCSLCHVQQYGDWIPSPMALAGTNAWVYDIYDGTGTSGGLGGFVYLRDSPHAEHNPASECRACHEPEGWAREPFTALAPLTQPTPNMLHGVSCDLCHKIADVDESRPNTPGIYPGAVTLTRPQGGAWAVAYGVLGDVSFSEPGQMRAAYQPQLVSAVCGSCHQDKNDHDDDGDFEDPGGVISEPTYLEWLDSPYADPGSIHYQSCADCHLPGTSAGQACVNQDPPLTRPFGDVRSHRIEGTSPMFLDAAVTLSMVLDHQGDHLNVEVAVVNDQTGHHVPTGVTIRNVLLLIEAWSEQEQLTLEHLGTQSLHELAGVGDPTQGYFAGLPGKLYAKANHGADGQGPVFFTDATGIQFDTRIPALQTDLTHYRFQVPESGGRLWVRARLIYRRTWRALLDAKQWTVDGHGQPLEDTLPPHFGHLMEVTQDYVDVPLTEPPCDGGVCLECDSDDECSSGQRCVDGLCVADDAHIVAGGRRDEAGRPGCGCRAPGAAPRSRAPTAVGLLSLIVLSAAARRRGRSGSLSGARRRAR